MTAGPAVSFSWLSGGSALNVNSRRQSQEAKKHDLQFSKFGPVDFGREEVGGPYPWKQGESYSRAGEVKGKITHRGASSAGPWRS